MSSSKIDRNHGWRFWVDRGGTFTDIVFENPEGKINTLKLLSNAPNKYKDSVVEGIMRCLKLYTKNNLVAEIHIGTTVATNNANRETATDQFNVDQSNDLSNDKVKKLYKEYVNPGLERVFDSFDLGNEIVDHAEGVWITTKNNEKILDITGGFGVLSQDIITHEF